MERGFLEVYLITDNGYSGRMKPEDSCEISVVAEKTVSGTLPADVV